MKLQLQKMKRLVSSPSRMIAISFAAVILTGTLLLMLPISSKEHIVTPFLDCLFTATSATCVTGLIVYDTFTHWSTLGQCIILSLIQIGGLGLVTLTTFFSILIGKKLGLRGMHLAQESVSSMGSDITMLIKTVISTALIVETAGALLLMSVFIPQYGADGIFISVFTSVSAFCNAGFDLMGRQTPFISLSNYNDSPMVIGVVGLLIIIGGIGFIVIHDFLQYHKSKTLTLHTRIVLVVTGVLILLGMLMTIAGEWDNPLTLGKLPTTAQKLGAAWFHSVSCRTAGFNTIPMESLTNFTKILSSVLMFFGAAPGSTGGGIKCTTVAVIFMTVYSVVRGDEDTIIFRRKVEKSAVYKSMAVMILGILAVTVTSGCIVATMKETHAVTGVDALFESVSAFATVGLSAGISAEANPLSKFLLIFSMYIGRLGPVSFFLSLAMRSTPNRKQIIPEGKIQIG
ncbi:potassium transporter TrkG [Oscillospiraceae bacterium PP1C4]